MSVCPSRALLVNVLAHRARRRPLALIAPAKSNPDVVVYAIAARDKAKAAAFAKKHGIPTVKDDYDGVCVSMCRLPHSKKSHR